LREKTDKHQADEMNQQVESKTVVRAVRRDFQRRARELLSRDNHRCNKR